MSSAVCRLLVSLNVSAVNRVDPDQTASRKEREREREREREKEREREGGAIEHHSNTSYVLFQCKCIHLRLFSHCVVCLTQNVMSLLEVYIL